MFKIDTMCNRFKDRLHEQLIMRPSKKKDTMIGLYFISDGKFIMWLSNEQIRMLQRMGTAEASSKVIKQRLKFQKESYYEGRYEVVI